MEHQTSDANSIFQFKDAVMTISPDGKWRCVIPQGITQAIRSGNVENLEQFLTEFAAVNG
jgi:hypothetical protein